MDKEKFLKWIEEQKRETESLEKKFSEKRDHDKAQEQKNFAMAFDYIVAAVNNPVEYELDLGENDDTTRI